MKHLIEIFDYPTNEEVAKRFTYTNTTNMICPVFPENSDKVIAGKIILSRQNIEYLQDAHYIFYIHTFGDIFNLNTDIYACVSLYNQNDKKYHLAITSVDNIKNKTFQEIHFIDLTTRLAESPEYWTPKYCKYNYERFHNYQTTLTPIFDTESEAKVDLLECAHERANHKIGKEKAVVISLNNKDVYEREFNKLFEPAVQKLKEDIETELNDRILSAEKNIAKLNTELSYIQEQLNTVINGTNK